MNVWKLVGLHFHSPLYLIHGVNLCLLNHFSSAAVFAHFLVSCRTSEIIRRFKQEADDHIFQTFHQNDDQPANFEILEESPLRTRWSFCNNAEAWVEVMHQRKMIPALRFTLLQQFFTAGNNS